jgi:tetratricopeptide (TPR) repeat protein
MLGRPQEGILLIREGLEDNLAMNVGLYTAASLLGLAEARASLGDPEQGLAELNEALELIEQTGERNWEAEIYRMRSALQMMVGDEKEAETSLQKALEVARQQSARWWELRAAIDLAHLWRKQGKAEQARQVVKEVYDWFTEGFDTPELSEARELCS